MFRDRDGIAFQQGYVGRLGTARWRVLLRHASILCRARNGCTKWLLLLVL